MNTSLNTEDGSYSLQASFEYTPLQLAAHRGSLEQIRFSVFFLIIHLKFYNNNLFIDI